MEEEDYVVQVLLSHGAEMLLQERVVVKGAKPASRLFTRMVDLLAALLQAEERRERKEG